ncbi:sensor histidine kinase [Planomonospora sp. ID67723]|uniref:sensor histidine kinase n=1 Tax=Planomonospora sp. ID67723 TaxID=2738134 RepID=UPI0018C4316B|nr:sensor histidine kinase [Planomonospora sp. ID67723]MBG0829701.1 sensor histidine kinase [Planomonospora sp. ID67723]
MTSIHQAAVYDSDERFLAMALPFISDGLAKGDPVLVVTTSANLDLLSDALGRDGRRVDYAETAFLGRRPVQRTTAFHRYWRRRGPEAPYGGHVRVIAEPMWIGRSPRDMLSWQRMESVLNLLMEGTNLWMICPYDARVLEPRLMTAARRTHPVLLEDGATVPCPEYTAPVDFVRECDAVPLPQPPAEAVSLRAESLQALRSFVSDQASFLGLTRDRATLLAVAVNEVATHLDPPVTAHLWERFGAITCQIHRPAGGLTDPLAGFVPPSPSSGPGDGLWIARQLCDRLDIHHDQGGCAVQLHVPSARAEELRQSRKY